MPNEELKSIGRVATISFPEDKISNLPAKIDTGADSSSVWATNIFVDDKNKLHYTLLADSHAHYSGIEHVTSHFGAKMVRSSNGQSQIRFSVKLLVVIEGKTIRSTFTLANRARNSYSVLVGCKLLKNKFVVDVSRGTYKDQTSKDTATLQQELKKDPRAFYKKYHNASDSESDVI